MPRKKKEPPDNSFQQVKDEMNLCEYPLLLLSRNSIAPGKLQSQGSQKLEYRTERFVNGQKITQRWVVTSSADSSLPIGGDQDVLMALMKIWEENGFKSRTIPIKSMYHLLKIIGCPINKRSYERLHEALHRLRSVRIYAENTFWNSEARKYEHKVDFDLFNHLDLKQDSKGRTSGYIVASDVLYKSVTHGNTKHLDFDMYRSLKTPLARKIYRFLDKKRYTSDSYTADLFDFAQHIGITWGVTGKKSAYRVLRLISPALRELQQRDYITRYEVHKVPTGQENKKAPGSQTITIFFHDLRETEYWIDCMIDDIMEVTGADHSIPWYRRVIRSLGEERARSLVYQALSLTKEAINTGQVKKTPDQYFIFTLKRLCKENNITI